MNIPGLLIIVLGIICIIFSVKDKDKVNIKNSSRFTIVNMQKFLSLQLYYSIIYSAGMIILGIIVIIYDLKSIYILPYGFVIIFTDYLILLIARGKKYIKLK